MRELSDNERRTRGTQMARQVHGGATSASCLAIVIATHNGAAVLGRTLEGYTCQTGAEAPWQLVVVDNASNDSSAAIISEFTRRLPLIVAREPNPGKNHALNTALDLVRSEFIVFSDDDAIPAPDFVASWERIHLGIPDCDLFGGVIEPVFDDVTPPWLRAAQHRFPELFAARDLPEGRIEASEIFGPNMAVRRRVFDRGLRFNGAIGPNSTSAAYAMGSETEFCRAAAARGHRAHFARRPKVSHIVRPHQLTPEFLVQRAYRHGKGIAQQHFLAGSLRLHDYRSIRYAVASSKRKLVESFLFLRLLGHSSSGKCDALWQYHWRLGFHEELRSLSRSGARVMPGGEVSQFPSALGTTAGASVGVAVS